ncbi:NAD(P)/FAD-dependent oxidoreductase [Streptomyces sp. GC420]|uniref:NAD(P)/FAD-dependent oxidoreductase n=1 Tax=Streptomyces sp. GC420 TaxID=2697568 RepID=UPI001414E7B1|nr:FAD-dependent oxidoreductase [Streptomyces sp. GC420]NBM14226.1 FAD-dependent oxidoreductase [Streptomyces sp. GC420]
MTNAIAVVGNGVAGVAAVQTLRAEGYDGRLFLIGDEEQPPYDRTALSKAVLAGELSEPPVLLPADRFELLDVESVAGRAVTRVDTPARLLHFADGGTLAADRVLLATGARARVPQIPGFALPGVGTLRKADDVQALREGWQPGAHVVVVGGGLIGCEVATTARKLGLEVTILEAADELLIRVLGRRIGSWCREQLEQLGVDVRLNTAVAEFVGRERLAAVVSNDGTRLEAESALVCVGAEPETTLAESMGVSCDRGIVVDESGRTSSPGVFAAGDAASWPLRAGGRRSLETYLNSQKQAAAAAAAMLDRSVPAPQVPLSWTEIAGHRLQMIGDFEKPGELVSRGRIGDDPAIFFRVVEGEAIAAVAVDSPRDFATATRLVESRAVVSPDALGESTIPLRELLKVQPAGLREMKEMEKPTK